MDSSVLLETIKKYGFAEYEAKCYLALFEKESLSVGEISSLAGVPRANIYGIMQKLLAKGLCVSLPGGIKKYSASDPGIFRNELINSLDESKRTIDGLTTELASLYETSRGNGGSLGYIEILKNHEQIHRKFIELTEESTREILVLSKSSNIRHYSPEKGLDVRLNTFKRGVHVKCVYELWHDENDNKLMFEEVELFVKAGEESRVIDNLPMQLAIFDSKITMFTLYDLDPGKSLSTVQVIEHPAMAQGLKLMFESVWERAEDFSDFKDKYMKKLKNNNL
jgi:sugar-specific transcriptional regulator TrmB